MTGEYVRRLSGGSDAGDVVLVGAVHDHPASTYRVVTTVECADPDVVALELPPLAVPLFERYAEDRRTPPAFGGEMSAAVQAASTDEVAGIDGPTPAFAGRLVRTLLQDGASLSTARETLRGLASVTRHAVVCRLAAALDARTGLRVEVDAPTPHDCDRSDDPQEQAADERQQVRRARAVGNVFAPPDPLRYRKRTREAHMARRLSTLRREGDVVGVVGIDHLDPLADRLADASE